MIISETPSDPSSSTHTTSFRIKRGTKLADLPHPDPVPALSHFDGPFQLAEYLALRIKADPHDVKSLVEVPSGDGQSGGKGPEKDVVSPKPPSTAGADVKWIYEHLRRLPIDLTPLITSLLPVCTKETCPEMKAQQWLYFCSAHAETSDCCALDYILHTMAIPPASIAHFPSLFRRLSRIFSHAYFHHREVFSLAEVETSLYARFVALCEHYDLVGKSLLVIPHDALSNISQGNEDSEEDEDDEDDEEEEDEEEEEEEEESDEDSSGHAARGRGENGDMREKRTRSLDRHGPPQTVDAVPSSKSAKWEAKTPIHNSPSKGAPTANGPLNDNLSPGNDDPFRSSPRNMTVRGTLGRGKQPRGTMLWTTDTAASSELPIGPELSRTESAQTAVLTEESLMEDLPLNEEPVDDAIHGDADEEEPVPKDEIELLEEEGVIPPADTVAPLPPPSDSQGAGLDSLTSAAEQEGGADETPTMIGPEESESKK